MFISRILPLYSRGRNKKREDNSRINN